MTPATQPVDKPSIFVLGAAQFLGEHVVRALGDAGFPVRTTQPASAAGEPAERLKRAVAGCGGVIDCRQFCPRDGLDINRARRRGVAQVRRLMEACSSANIVRLVYVSSPVTLGLGAGPDAMLDEHDRYVPGSVADAHYEASWAMEAELYRYVGRTVAATVAIPAVMFGPGKAAGPAGRLLAGLSRGRLSAVFGRALAAVDVRDVADSVVAALERGRPGRRYVLGGTNTTVADFAGRVAAAAGVDRPRFHLPTSVMRRVARLGEAGGRRLGWDTPALVVGADRLGLGRPLCDRRARQELGHCARPLATTIADALAWLDARGSARSSAPTPT